MGAYVVAARTTNELYLVDAVIEPERLVQISLGQENPRMRMNAAPGSLCLCCSFVVPPSGGIRRDRCADFRLKAGLRTQSKCHWALPQADPRTSFRAEPQNRRPVPRQHDRHDPESQQQTLAAESIHLESTRLCHGHDPDQGVCSEPNRRGTQACGDWRYNHAAFQMSSGKRVK